MSKIGNAGIVLEAILSHYDRVAGHATRQRPYTTAQMGHD